MLPRYRSRRGHWLYDIVKPCHEGALASRSTRTNTLLVPGKSFSEFHTLTLRFNSALDISGEAIEAEFASWIKTQITTDDYPGNLPELFFRIGRKFKEGKKLCGMPARSGLTTWNIKVPKLRDNPDKGFVGDNWKIERYIQLSHPVFSC